MQNNPLFVDLKSQFNIIERNINEAINNVLQHGKYIMGPEVIELENRLANYVGVSNCISTSSGTDTLIIALLALGIGQGDEVITTPFTFIATAEAIALVGAKPVFVDIDPYTYNLNSALIPSVITQKTRAIIPVSLYGQCCDMDEISEIANKHNLYIIEDAAQSFGATYKGRKSCGLSLIGSTSFFPSKPLGAYGDGGALFTNDDILAKKMRSIRIHGQDGRYNHTELGVNGRLDTLQAAILLAKLDIFDKEILLRQKVATHYNRLISMLIPSLKIPHVKPFNSSVYAQYTIMSINRDQLSKNLERNHIPYAVHYPTPLHLQPVFRALGYKSGDFPIAEEASKCVLSLPMHPYLTEAEQQNIIECLV